MCTPIASWQCPEGVCESPEDASKPECEACTTCNKLSSSEAAASTVNLRQNGALACEGHGYGAAQCEQIGCCQFAECPIGDGSGECRSAVGEGECVDTVFDSHTVSFCHLI